MLIFSFKFSSNDILHCNKHVSKLKIMNHSNLVLINKKFVKIKYALIHALGVPQFDEVI